MRRTKEALLHGEGIDRPMGLFTKAKHTWTPASTLRRPCILRWHKGELEQLYFCKESRQAKWKKIPKEAKK